MKSVKSEVLGSAAIYPDDPDRESRLKTGQQLFFNLTESVRQNSAKESEKGRAESLAVKLQQQRMAQIEALPHRHPARCLKHISQAWKDSPCSPQDHWRWTSSGAEDEKQVNQREKMAKSCKISAPNRVPNFLPACSRIGLRTNKIQMLVSMRCKIRRAPPLVAAGQFSAAP